MVRDPSVKSSENEKFETFETAEVEVDELVDADEEDFFIRDGFNV